jgi:hypothetical protein
VQVNATSLYGLVTLLNYMGPLLNKEDTSARLWKFSLTIAGKLPWARFCEKLLSDCQLCRITFNLLLTLRRYTALVGRHAHT